ncbi:MAG: ankyrin repeat domain-containing protein [Crocinitomicaceae bacterium]
MTKRLHQFIAVVSIMIVSTTLGQDNVLIDRSYWKQQPSLKKVKADVAAGNDPAAFNQHTFDAVTWAILESADDAIVWYLINLDGNEVNKRSHDGRTPIFWAAYKNNVTLMKELIEKGANTDLMDSHGYSLVSFAASTGQTNQEVYNFCLEHGAKFNEERNKDGANPIHLIIPYLEDATLIEYFSKNGVSLKAEDKNGNNIFTYAAKTGNIPMMEYALSKGIDPHANNDAAVIFASKGTRSKSTSIEGFKFLQEHGLNLNTTDKDGRSALYYLASKSKDMELFEMLVQAGLKTDQSDNQGVSPLNQAAANNSGEVVKFLAYHSRDISAANTMGENALHIAVNHENKEAVKVLLEMGMDINVVTNEQLSPLHLAAMKAKDIELLQFLIEKGADKTLDTQFGETAYDLALENEMLQNNKTNLDFLKP